MHPWEGAECECRCCGRRYMVRMALKNKWGYTTHCSLICSNARQPDRRAFSDFSPHPLSGETVFDYLLQCASGIYRQLLRSASTWGADHMEPVYWVGWNYETAHPYRFAGAFLDRTEQMMFMSDKEYRDYANRLFEQANDQHREHQLEPR